MKSKFAKFTDATVGTCLIFTAAVAVFGYYTTTDLAVFSALSVTACVLVLLRFRSKKRDASARLSAAANEMFFEFMFMSDDAPVKLLQSALKAKDPRTVRHGKGVYIGKCAAFCFFAEPPTDGATAYAIAKAKHYGANKITLLCKTAPVSAPPPLDGFTVKTVCGDDVYKLFASVGAVPDKKFTQSRKSRFAAFAGALSGDKALRYALLSVSLGFAAYIGKSLIPFIFAVVSAVLAVLSVIFSLKRKFATERNE